MTKINLENRVDEENCLNSKNNSNFKDNILIVIMKNSYTYSNRQ